jgi:uncharacterized heparinase superfamily protein
MSERRPGVEAQPALALAAAALMRARGSLVQDWRGSQLYRATLRGPSANGVAVTPRDYRPPDMEAARALLTGRLVLADETLEIGQGGDPWDTASPSRPFAVALHRFTLLPGLIATVDPDWAEYAREEALRLTLDWLTLFAPVTPFAWGAETMERRVYRWACAMPELFEIASDLERRRLLDSLAEQARHLLRLDEGPARAAERTAAAALAGTVLAGKAGDGLLEKALPRLARALRLAVLPDGGLKTRSPEQGLELLHDLLTLDDALHQRGMAAPEEISRAIDRLTGATRFFTLGDGRLGAFQGGESGQAARIAAAVAHEDASARVYGHAPHSGYHRLAGRSILALVDAAPAADGPWSTAACAQPLALEVSCGADRMIVNAGWSPDAQGPASFRLSEMGSTATIGDGSAGAPLTGFAATALGPRLTGGAVRIEARRHEDEAGVWLDLTQDGWVASFGLLHERRLFLDLKSDELRGEDCFMAAPGSPLPRKRLDPFALRFHLAQDVRASLARDKRSVLLRGPSNRGWWFRNDAPDVALEPSVHFEEGTPRRTLQVVLKGQIGLDGSARVRWKLTPVEPADPLSPASAA